MASLRACWPSANFLFPFATAAFIAVGVSLDVGGICHGRDHRLARGP
jgi:hypothetical protein